MREDIFNTNNLRKNKDKDLLNKVKKSKVTTNNFLRYNIVTISSIDDLYLLNLNKEKVCVSREKDGMFMYRIKDNTLYYIPIDLISEFNKISVYIISYNIKEIIKYFKKYNVEIKYCWDCYIAARILNENTSDTSLDGLYKLYINENDSQAVIKIYKLYKFQEQHLNKNNTKNIALYNLYHDIELPCIRVIANMEMNGIQIDYPYLFTLMNIYTEDNYNSHYLNNLYKALDDNSVIHSNINQYAAVTGRMSISNPNLQNIPNNKEARDIFIPRQGNIFISADYSQQEIRILAELCNDPKMIDIFNNNKDIYAELASLIFNLSYEDCLEKNNKDIRTKTKRILLSIIYGVGYKSLSEQLNCSIDEVKNIKQEILNIFKNIQIFEASTIEDAKTNKYVQTVFGRKRRFHNVDTDREYRQAINSKIQGTGADILKFVLVKLYNNKELQKLGVKLIIPIHDEILFECPIENTDKATKIIKDIMENSFSEYLHISMKCDIILLSKWGTEYINNGGN